MAERKIALIIAGGVSLGSYEGGVLTELLYQLDHYNKSTDGNRYVIDVITGGSAGSITGALTARVMMHGYPNLRRILHDLWVEDADVVKMLEDSSDNSLFASNFQKKLGKKYLGTSADTPQPATFAPEELRLAFSLSNMVGIDYGFPYGLANTVQKPPPEDERPSFVSTFFSDFFDATVRKGAQPDTQPWDKIRAAAIASGGFPVAFAPSIVGRKNSDFPGANPTNPLPGDHAISDGGMFNNEPVRRAILLAADLDGGVLSGDRVFILIDPNINTSKQDKSFLGKGQEHGLFDIVKRLLFMALGEAEARDWLRVSKFNARLNWRDGLIEVFGEIVKDLNASSIVDSLKKAKEKSGGILQKLEEFDSQLDPADRQQYLDRALERIAKYHGDFLTALALTDDDEDTKASRVELFKHLVFSIDSAASLTSKSPIELFVIGADKSETAGEGLFSLAGFFEEHWREHDYRLGRRVAWKLIPEFLKKKPGPERESGVDYENEDAWGDLTMVQIGDADESRRKTFYRRVKDQIDRILATEPFDLNWLFRKLAICFVIGPKIKRALGL